jgi:hypothetical protein
VQRIGEIHAGLVPRQCLADRGFVFASHIFKRNQSLNRSGEAGGIKPIYAAQHPFRFQHDGFRQINRLAIKKL